MRRGAPARTAGVAIAVAMAIGSSVSEPVGARTLQPSDVRRLVELQAPAISPDGRRVALISIAADATGTRSISTLSLVDVATRRIVPVVYGRDVAVPRWSSDGTRLGYLARPRDGANLALYVRDAAGTSRQVATARGNIVDFAWRPDSAAIAFAAEERAPARDYFFAGDNDVTATAAPVEIRLWTVAATGASAKPLTRGSTTLPQTDPGGIFTSQFAWVNSRTLVYTRLPNAFPGDSERSTLYRYDVATGRSAKLTGHAKFEVTPLPSPDGQRLAYWYPRDGDFLAENTVRVRSGANETELARSLDRNVGGTLWMPDSRGLLACADDGAHVRAWLLPLNARPRRVSLGRLEIVCDSYSSSTFDAGIAASVARTGAIAFLATDDRHARELYVLGSLSSRPRRLTSFNAFTDRLDLGRREPIAWVGPDGFHETGVVTYPPRTQPSRRYPIVLLIHGGPGLASDVGFVWERWPLASLIAARGYVVFQPNYRGSDDGGNTFMRAIYRDTVTGPGRDIMAGLAVVERLPQADGERIAVSGWSYGGLLTSWLTTQSHAWRAAVSGAAVTDEIASYDLSVSNVQNAYYFGTSPHVPHGMQIYADQSPIVRAESITTPTLIWGTTGDPVVPIASSYAMYHALRDNHVPVALAVFVAGSHGPATPREVQELTVLWTRWLDRFMK